MVSIKIKMIWFIIGFIVFITATIYICCQKSGYFYDRFDKILDIGIAFLVSLLLSVILLLIGSLVTDCCAKIDYNIESDTKIIALKDNQNTNGNFYIMGGYVDETLYYYYAIETELGYKTEKISSENAYIKYTDGATHIEKHKGKFVNEWVYLFGFPLCDDRYIIYCPEGTVTNEFSVDLE